MINNILQYAVETGSHGGASAPGKTVAAKTGTSSFSEETIAKYGLVNDPVNDLWTCAYTPEYAFSLWYGYNELTSEYYNHNSYPYKNNLMRQLVKVVPMTTKQFEIPDTVVQSQVEFGTWPAQLPSENTPADLIRTEYFKKGKDESADRSRDTRVSLFYIPGPAGRARVPGEEHLPCHQQDSTSAERGFRCGGFAMGCDGSRGAGRQSSGDLSE